MNSFEEGYRFYAEQTGAAVAAFGEDEYVEKVAEALDDLEKDINNFEVYNTPVAQLKGDIFEFWHSDTFNLDAVLNDSSNRTFVDRSHDLGSVDISSNFGADFGLKAYQNGEASAKAQAVSAFQQFKEYQSNGGTKDLASFMEEKGLSYLIDQNSSLYENQYRIIPGDQISDATQWLKQMVATEATRRPEQMRRYEETLAMLKDRLFDNEGNESIPLTKNQAEDIARLAKEGGFKASDFGLTTDTVINYEHIADQALKAGLTAAVITAVLKTAPEVYKVIDHLIKTGELDLEQVKTVGFTAVSGGAEGFLRGGVASALTVACEAGLFGEALKAIPAPVIGAMTTITINAIKNAFYVAEGKKTRKQLENDLIRDMFVSACALAGGAIGQSVIAVPVIGYMLGSFVGSVTGSFAYVPLQKATVALCVDSGLTMFGLVEQDYTLPKEVIEEIGISTFDYETFEYDTFEPETFEFETFSYDTFEPETLGITCLRRGVIGVSKIGYV